MACRYSRGMILRSVLLAAMLQVAFSATARADDGFASSFARAVRTSTTAYRLVVWARANQYMQSSDYVAGLGTMFMSGDRFDPKDLAHPSMLVYDEAGRLVACGYQFRPGVPTPHDFDGVPASAWYQIPAHVHYNVRVDGQLHFGQASWESSDAPTFENLRKRNLIPANGRLETALVHPATRAIMVWAWLPNDDGLFAGENSQLP
jgi:hypothetical protein